MPPNKVGEAYVEIKAETEKAKKGIDETRQSTERLGDTATRTAGRVRTAFRRMGDSARNLAGRFTQLVGAASAIAGAITLVDKAAEGLSDRFRTGRDRANEFFSTLEGGVGEDLQRDIDKISTRLNELYQELDRRERDLFDFRDGNFTQPLEALFLRLADSKEDLEQFIEILENRRASLEQTIRKFRSAGKDAGDDFAKAVEQAIDRLEARLAGQDITGPLATIIDRLDSISLRIGRGGRLQ